MGQQVCLVVLPGVARSDHRGSMGFVRGSTDHVGCVVGVSMTARDDVVGSVGEAGIPVAVVAVAVGRVAVVAAAAVVVVVVVQLV